VTAAALAALPLLAVPTPAHAHGGDPTLVTEYLGTSPPLPDAVVIQVRTTAGEQMVVQNNSATVLEVDDPGKRPFLRISSAGVQADVAAPFFHASLNPPDASLQLPSFAGDYAPARWEQVSADDAWGWFDPRLHPFEPGKEPSARPVPKGVRGEAVIADWQIPMRYGTQDASANGALERRPLDGAFRATVAAPPAGLTAVVAQGSPPALLLRAPAGTAVVVTGVDGVPFLRINSDGAFANGPAAALAATRSWWPGRRPPTAGCGWGNPARPTGSTTG
jgi:hypothetical protein